MKPNRLSLLLSALLLALPRFAHSATLPTYDPLDYGAGYDLGAQSDTNGITTVFSWTHIGVTGARPGTINVASGNLFYAGLTNSVGNSITNPAGPSQGLRYQSRNVNVYSGGIFYSALIKLNSLGTLATGDQILALNNTSTTNQTTDPTTIPGRLFVRKDSVDGTKYNIGVAWGSAVVTPTYASGQFAVGSTHLVVVKYDNTAAKASLWLDPNPADLGAASAPAGNIDNTTGSGGAVIQSLLVINQTATTPSYAIDDVRLGLSWASVTTPGAPGFTAQPVNATTNYGSNATFSVTAVGATVAGTISYVWKTNGVPTSDGPTGSGSVISGSTTATLTISGVSQADEVSYSVTASNLNGATDSSSAVLSVNDPRIVTQPTVSNPSPLPGAVVNFPGATADGSPTLAYRWQKDGVNVNNGIFGGTTISGADTATLTIQGVRAGGAGDSGSYRLWVTNGLGRAVSSSPLSLTVNDPVIVSSSASAAKNFNESVTFNATISGTAPPFTYQWKKDGVNINNGDLGGRAHVTPVGASASTATSLTIDDLVAGDAASTPGYTVTVTDNGASSATSAAATLSVTDPIVTTPVANVLTNAGATAKLRVQASGSGSVTYVWKTNGVAVANGLTPWGSTISGATTDTLLIANVTGTDAKSYTVEVSGAGATQTSSGSLSVAQITVQPAPGDLIVVAGYRAVFSATATVFGTGSLTYQWVNHNGIPYATQTSPVFKIENVQASDADNAIRLRVYYTGTDFILSDPVALAVTQDNNLRSGHLVVARVGDGSQPLTNAALPASIYFDQFDTSGNYISTQNAPDSGADAAVTYVNVATSSGLNTTPLQRSADGRYLVFAAFNTNLAFSSSLTAANSAVVPRSVGVLGPASEYSLFKDTALISGNNYRAALYDGTNDFWGAGTTASTGNAINGVFYIGSSSPSSTAISTAANAGAANIRCARYFNVSGEMRLYFDSANAPAGLYYISGFPKTGGQTVVTNLTFANNGAGTGAPGATDFAVSPDGNTIYVADGRAWSVTVANTTGGIQKWTNGVLDKVLRADPATTVGTMYLTVDFSANPPVIYAVTTAFGASLDQNELVKIVDDGSASGVATVLATSGPNLCFRGVSFGPTVQTPHIDSISILPDRNVRLTVSGTSNVLYSVQGSASLVPAAWTSLVTNSGPNGTFIFDDLTATNYPERFYRAYYRP